MGYKRYIFFFVSFLLAIALDAFIFTGLLAQAYSRVPMTYHLGNIVMLTLALAILGDMVFKTDFLR